MQFPNKIQLNLIFDIVLDLLLDCYILRNMKLLFLIKLGLAIKKILHIYDVNLLNYLSSESYFLIEYIERKCFTLREDNAMMKRYL